jgi:hypothetical protein
VTIAAAWVRTLEKGAEELIFCSDSRLSGGKRFDQCQKIFRFARTDAAICFAGGTDWAYPMIIAAIKAADLHVPSQTRSLSLAKFKSHVVNIVNQMQREVHNFVQGENIPDVTFLLGGYDWWKKCFRLWRLQFDEATKKFRANERIGSNKFGTLGKIEIAGDPEWSRAMRKGLRTLVQQKYGADMRPIKIGTRRLEEGRGTRARPGPGARRICPPIIQFVRRVGDKGHFRRAPEPAF